MEAAVRGLGAEGDSAAAAAAAVRGLEEEGDEAAAAAAAGVAEVVKEVGTPRASERGCRYRTSTRFHHSPCMCSSILSSQKPSRSPLV